MTRLQNFYLAKNPLATNEKEAGPKPEHCHGWHFCPYQNGLPAGWLEPEEKTLKKAPKSGRRTS